MNMNYDLLKARELLEENGYTCVVCRETQIHATRDRGVKPLLTWLEQGLQLQGFSAADRVVGRATAFLYVLLSVDAVFAQVMSRPAAAVLKDHGIEVHSGTLVEGIVNRQGDGPCPFEAAVLSIQDPVQALAAIHAKREQMQGGN